ncbi:MAG: RagB/SusD family nutrient uptake outer membrane protein [Candidatus Symbiothrix sp.]|jgi:hypothetical protein|nr:RagB/SusD family nutrient uptake outer membrane protein [Candidatus Symbiothrix sp.]
MKNITLLLIVSLVFGAYSCNEYLDVRPENQILLEEMWQKESDVEAVLLACYRAMQENDFMNRVIIWGELRSDNMLAGNSAGDAEKKINEVNILPTNGDCTWGAFYKVINYCNTVLEYAPAVVNRDPNFTQSDLKAKEAEALAIRALCHFYLVRTFRDIPWVDKATISDDQILEVPQSAPDEILQHITNDLLTAEAGALSVYPTTAESKGRMTKDAIRAMLADVYLWRQDYENCVKYCDLLIDAVATNNNFSGSQLVRPKYELIEENASSKIFDQGNASESIFELQFSTVKTNEAVSVLYGSMNSMGQLTATTVYAETNDLYVATDERKTDFMITSKSGTGEYKIFKYLGTSSRMGTSSSYSYKATTANWIFYRITDVMLMKAEALVQLNRSEDDLKTSLHLINTTYMRANSTLLASDSLAFANYSTPAALEKLVLLERQRELMFEGKRWFDLVRHAERRQSTADLVAYVINKYTSNIGTISAKLGVMNAIYLPIHSEELKVNKLLKQNPYYETTSSIEKN